MSESIDYQKLLWKNVLPAQRSLVLRLSDSQKWLQLEIRKTNINFLKPKKRIKTCEN